jgi:BolA family transcriptional regulator, general stress-responsive regulator
MGPIAIKLQARLTRHFAPIELSVQDDSAKHRGHAGHREGVETHFTVLMVSARFEGQTRLVRQRAVLAELADLMDAPIHALSLKLFAPSDVNAERSN